ncbi:MAG: serine acetyltransferase, partial [Deltaproteobacteria bacterium]|nr:serine acetyltransferase [Deltaproteobacteria bacterium]
LYLGYGENITIAEYATIGNNVNVNHGAVIGRTNRGNKKGVPTIGDCVWIGTNAVVVGNIIIGNNALIAPLSHVNFDVPENAVVAGNPAKIISYKGTDGYITKKWM